MRHFYSPSTGGFYDDELHGDAIPADAIKISAAKLAALQQAHAEGAELVVTAKGPIAVHPKDDRELQLELATRRVKREARRRCLAVASLEQQSNDNAELALAALQAATDIGMTIDVAPALERRRRVDAIRAASNAIEQQLGRLSSTALAAFAPAENPAWPTFEEQR